MLIKVRDKKTGVVRTVTHKAYAALGAKVYEKLGVVNDDGTEISGSPNSNTPQVQRSVKAAEPVVHVRTQLVNPAPVQPAAEEVKEEPATPEPVKKKPGRQPGSKNKSISSNSDSNEA